MSLYQCEECGCVENTALGFYHIRNADWAPTVAKGRALCSVCGPTHYDSGEPTKWGQWHDRFTRTFYPKGSLYTDHEGNVRRKSDNKYPSDS